MIGVRRVYTRKVADVRERLQISERAQRGHLRLNVVAFGGGT